MGDAAAAETEEWHPVLDAYAHGVALMRGLDADVSPEAIAARQEELAAVNEELRQQTEQLIEATRALAEQRRFAETLLERLPAGVTYIDKDFVFRVVNPALSQFYGVPREQLLGRRVDEALPGDLCA